MSRLEKLLQKKKDHILNIYFTAGYPRLNDTVDIIKALHDANVDLIEIGMPYSDPLADGPTIQASSAVSLKNGMSLDLLFSQIKEARAYTDMPFIMMGYFNQVMQYGEERFIKTAKESGVDCMILPDLPVEEFQKHYQSLFQAYGMEIAFLITPRTPEARIKHIDEVSNSFIYMVSSNSITGAKSNINQDQKAYFERIGEMKLKNPRLIGFGISNKSTFEAACASAHGAIIGSAFINMLEQGGDLNKKINSFIRNIID